MINMKTETDLSSKEVMETAVAFFGPDGLGLEIVSLDECCARFEGVGGHVFIQVDNLGADEGSEVNIEGREWEQQIKQFLGQL
jgi:hypothetical protein